MCKSLNEQMIKEYGLEMLNCILGELAKIQGFDRVIMVRHAHDFLAKECAAETESLLLDEKSEAEYFALKNKLNALSSAKKEQLISLLEIENITMLLKHE